MHRTATMQPDMQDFIRYCAMFLPAFAALTHARRRICRRIVIASLRKSLRLIRISNPTPRLSPLVLRRHTWIHASNSARIPLSLSLSLSLTHSLIHLLSLLLLFFSSTHLSESWGWSPFRSRNHQPFLHIRSSLRYSRILLFPPPLPLLVSLLPSAFCLGFSWSVRALALVRFSLFRSLLPIPLTLTCGL